jgi:hypothetical protein
MLGFAFRTKQPAPATVSAVLDLSTIRMQTDRS